MMDNFEAAYAGIKALSESSAERWRRLESLVRAIELAVAEQRRVTRLFRQAADLEYELTGDTLTTGALEQSLKGKVRK